jgi:hypothetical protein
MMAQWRGDKSWLELVAGASLNACLCEVDANAFFGATTSSV